MPDVIIVGSGKEVIDLIQLFEDTSVSKIIGIANVDDCIETREYALSTGIPIVIDWRRICIGTHAYLLVLSDDKALREEIQSCISNKFQLISKDVFFFLRDIFFGNDDVYQRYFKNRKTDLKIRAQDLDHMNQAIKLLYFEMEEKKDIAEKINEAISKFLVSITQEMRTPLNAIMGFSNLLSGTMMDDPQKIYTQSILENGKILQAFIEKILDISKLTTSQIILDEVDFELENLVESVINEAKLKIKDRNVNLSYEIVDDILTSFKGDPSRIRQTLDCLVSNAIQFTSTGEVSVSVGFWKTEDMDKEKRRRTLVFSVKDTGIGIPSNRLEDIFKPFVQVHDFSSAARSCGAGLGLTVARAIIQKMGGNIQVESEFGRGSEFVFTITLREVMPVAAYDIAPLSLKDLESMRVLILDQNNESLRILETFCRNLKMEICALFGDEEDSIKWLSQEKEKPPDLILTDMMFFSNKHEFDWLSYIEAIDTVSKPKLIGITSEPGPGTALEAQKAGFHGFLIKPLNEADLRLVVQTTLGDHRGTGQIVTRHLARELFLKGLNVLVAESNPIIRDRFKDQLEKLGMCVSISETGESVLECIKKTSISVILMDMDLNGLDGLETTRKIRANGNADTIILGIIEPTTRRGREKCIDAGMNDFVIRPVEFQKIKQKLYKWIQCFSQKQQQVG